MMKVRNLFHQTKVEVRVPKIIQIATFINARFKRKLLQIVNFIACESNEANKIFILLSNEGKYILFSI